MSDGYDHHVPLIDLSPFHMMLLPSVNGGVPDILDVEEIEGTGVATHVYTVSSEHGIVAYSFTGPTCLSMPEEVIEKEIDRLVNLRIAAEKTVEKLENVLRFRRQFD